MSSQTPQKQVRRRRVFYIPGYDPIPPRRYRELYRKEARIQAKVSGYEIAIQPGAEKGAYGWQVTSTQDGATVETGFQVLVWSDIVQNSMDQSIVATYLQLLRTAWIYLATGTLWRLMQLRKGPVIAALYPVAVLLLQLIFALLVGWGLGRIMWPVIGWAFILPSGAAIYVFLRWFRRIDNKLFAYYLMHDYAHSARLNGQTAPEMQARLDEFTETISQALTSDVDEVLIVGHSSGAHLGVTVLAKLLDQNPVSEPRPELSFLSLGQVVPMVSFLPGAYQLRKDLQALAQCSDITWVDVSAPGDGCAFALCDPVAVSGVAGPGKRWPLVLSAAFTQTLSPSRWNALRWRFFRLHFQYLCAFDRPGEYDYFRITAGPLTLGQRFRARAPSKSRIERAVSKYTSVTA